MRLERLFPAAGAVGGGVPGGGIPDGVDLDATGAADRIAELYRPPAANWLRINLIGSVSGGATGPDGTSETLTAGADRAILKAIRGLADAVVVGAGTIRIERYVVPRDATLVIVSRSGDLSGSRLVEREDREPPLVLCPPGSAARVRATAASARTRVVEVGVAGPGELVARDIRSTLEGLGYRSIVAEGGPRLAAALLGGGVVDELCLTTSPVANGAASALLGPAAFGPVPLELTQLLRDDSGSLYARWLTGRGPGDVAG